MLQTDISRGFNGSVNIPESCDVRSQFVLINLIYQPLFINTFYLTFLLKSNNKIRKFKDY